MTLNTSVKLRDTIISGNIGGTPRDLYVSNGAAYLDGGCKLGDTRTNGGVMCFGGSNSIETLTGNGSAIISSGAIVDLTGNSNATPIAPGGGITLYGGASLSPTTIVCSGSSRIFEDVEIHGTTISDQGIIYGATVYSDVGDDHYIYFTEDGGATSSSVIVTGATEYVVPGGLMQVSGT